MEDPAKIGRFEIIERVGRGGMGVLYRGRDPLLDREVAIKVMAADLSDDEEARARFFREAKAAARLQHRNIVTVYEFGEDDGRLYIAMEFLRGESLAALMRSESTLSLDHKLDIVVQLCTGLHHAHAAGVIHRDVKPGNVWIQTDGTVKLLDFGIARVAASTMTQGRDTTGSVSYMAPERFGNGPVDSRADIFAVGVILYELLAGKKPFEGDSPTVIVNKILSEFPPRLHTVVPGLPQRLLAVVDRALEKEASARYQTCSELSTDVQLARVDVQAAASVKEDQPLTLRAEDAPSEIVENGNRPEAVAAFPRLVRTWVTSIRSPGMTAAVLVVLVLAGVIWAGIASHRSPGESQAGDRNGQDGRSPAAGEARQTTSPTAPSSVMLRVESVPAGAAIALDGVELQRNTPADVAVSKDSPARLRLTKAGFSASESLITADQKAAGRVSLRLEPLSQDPVTVVAEGSYPFEILEGNRVLSPASESHPALTLKGRRTLRLRASQYLLDQFVTVDPAIKHQWQLQAPELGSLYILSMGSYESCGVKVGGKALGLFPIDKVSLAPGDYTLTLDCPGGPGPRRVTIRPGEALNLSIK